MLLNVTAMMGTWSEAAASRVSWPLRWLRVTNKSRPQTDAGASQPSDQRRTRGLSAGLVNNPALHFSDGRRGVQERNRISKGFHSFIGLSFQTGSQFLQTVTIAARHGIRGTLKQLANFFKGVFMPDFQDDHFALFHRQAGQATHRDQFARASLRQTVEPPARFQFARQPPPP